MAKQRYSNIPKYYRKGHYTSGHKRALNDGMMLELAEGNGSENNFFDFILLPDPYKRKPARWIREDEFFKFSPQKFNAIVNFIKGSNSEKVARNLVSRYNQAKTFLRDEYGDENSTSAEDVAGYVDLALELYNLFFGDDDAGSGGSPGGGVSLVGTNGFLYCIKNIPSLGNVGFGISPDGTQLIAFSSPDTAMVYFPQWYQMTNVPQMPPSVPIALIMKACQHPNTIVTIPAGSGGGSGSGSGGGSGSGSGGGSGSGASPGLASLFPLALIGGLVWYSTK